MTERKGFHGPGLETKGGGYHGGPKRWTGRGPAPARHVPWPEVSAFLAFEESIAYQILARSSNTIFPSARVT